MPVYVAKPGGYVGRASDGGVESTRQWLRGGSTLLGTGLSYETVGADAGQMIEYVEQAGNLAGMWPQKRVVAQPEIFPTTVQFRDSYIEPANNFAGTRPFGPSASYGVAGTYALRFTLRSVIGTTSRQIVASPFVTLGAGNVTGANKAMIYPAAGFGAASVEITAAAQDTPVSLLVAFDGAAGLPGGKSLSIWAQVGAGAAGEIASGTGTVTTAAAPVIGIGAITSASTGWDFDVSHWVWAHDAALNPADNWSNFFNADGTVKNLGAEGVVDGVAPKLYMKGFDFDGSGSTLNNSGTGPSAGRFRTALTVVAP